MDSEATAVLGPADVGLASSAVPPEHEAVTRMTPTPKATAPQHLPAGMWRRLPCLHGLAPDPARARRPHASRGSGRPPDAQARSRRAEASPRHTRPAPWDNGSGRRSRTGGTAGWAARHRAGSV